jgi:predicted acylesterase/phospholipase RssA
VLTGSGINAAYEVGVMKALLRDAWGIPSNPPVEPYCYSGTSVGALNAAVMVAMANRSPAEALDYLESLWIDRIGVETASSSTGIFRIRAEPTQYFSTATYARNVLKPFAEMGGDMLYFAFQTMQRIAYATASANTLPDGAVLATELNAWLDLSPLRELVRDSIDPTAIASSPTALRLTALEWERGTPRIFGNQDFALTDGHDVLLAALSMPVMMQPQNVDGVPYVDASVLSDMPLRPAIKAAPDSGTHLTLHTVYVDAQRTPIPVPVISNTFATVYRLYLLALSRAVNTDIQRTEMVNTRIRMLDLLTKFAKLQGRTLDDVIGGLALEAPELWKGLLADTETKVPITVHRFHPSKNVRGFELIQFQRQRIRQLIRDGYEDASRHDCRACNCMLYEISPASATSQRVVLARSV